MNTLIKYIGIGSVLFTMACSNRLDTAPDGGTLTQDQINDIYTRDPTKLVADVNGLYNTLKDFSGRQNEFGYPSIAMKMDINGQDIVSDVTGYNWFSASASYTDRPYDLTYTYYNWQTFYAIIRSANAIILNLKQAMELPDDNNAKQVAKEYTGQAKAMRAFAYFNLIQTYQFTYKGHENALGVPIITEDTPIETALFNNPRASVSDVYKLILLDLDSAISDLQAYKRADHSSIDQAIAYGLRARVNLVMQNWNEAASDAQNALSISGAAPSSYQTVSAPSFYDGNSSNVMWASMLTSDDAAAKSGICNFESMFTSLCFGVGGYTTMVGTWKKINVQLYDQIPATDIRKQWWLDGESKSSCFMPNMLGYEGDSAYLQLTTDYGAPMEPYTNVKFAPEDNDMNSSINSGDFMLMRPEEMIFIIAEGQAMGGQAAVGAQTLVNFVQTYRDPSYTLTATSPVDVQNAVWMQRRIELWGEGFSWFDLMRLKKPVSRMSTKTNFSEAEYFDIPAESAIMLYLIPQKEINANTSINDADNNPTAPQPLPQPLPITRQTRALLHSSSLNNPRIIGKGIAKMPQ